MRDSLFPHIIGWRNQDVFILGGGPSVKRFDVNLLKDRKVIGCNDAYLFGEEIVDICFFGDCSWFNHHRGTLNSFNNLKITNSDTIHHDREDERIIKLKRSPVGFHKDSIGWNGNSGAAAINLALILGAKRIYLIGFDMKLGLKGESNWHPNPLDNPTEEVHYKRYQDALDKCAWKGLFPDTEAIINLNPDSALECFPKSTWDKEFSEVA